MSLHPHVLNDLLRAEADVARDRLGARAESLTVDGDHVDVTFQAHGHGWHLRLTGRDYDRLPVSVAFLDANGEPLPAEGWPPGVAFQAPHPVLGGAAWACLRGTLEYHLYPGHTAGGDSWDANRASLRLPHVISHLLEKSGA